MDVNVNMANLAVSTDFTPDIYLRNYLNYNDQRMENQFTSSTTSSMDSESCSSESLTDIKSIVYDNDLLNMDIQQPQIKQEYNWPVRPVHKSRPGRKAKLADSELTPIELEKRELRRLRNKQAARRCRQRRLEKTFSLEQKVSFLHSNNVKLESENIILRRQVEHLQQQIELQNNQSFTNYQTQSGVISEIDFDHRNQF